MYASAMKQIGDENEVKQLFSRCHTSHKLTEMAYQVRWERIKEAVSDLDVQKIEAEALWGNKIRDSLEPCYQHIDTLKASFIYYNLDISKRDNDKFSKSEKIVMNFQPLYGEKDEFGDSFAVAIKNASEVYRSYLLLK